jgi:hypothetical protein
MSNAATDPMPLDGPPEPPQTTPQRPLSWLRERLFRDRRPAAEPSTLPVFQASTGRGQALRKAHAELQSMFATDRGLSQVFPHLSLFEKALARQGSQALRRLPSRVLQRALEEVQELELTRAHTDLSVLRSRVIEELALRSVRTGSTGVAAESPPVPESPAATAVDDPADTDLNWTAPPQSSRRH